MVTGKVEKIISNKWGFFNVKVNNTWYGVGKKTPPCNEGDNVAFESVEEVKGENKYYSADMSTFKQVAAPVVNKEVPVAQTAPGNKDNYWANKEERDVVTQTKIGFQAARNSAISVAAIALDNGLLTTAKKSSMNLDLLLSLVDELTLRFAEDTEVFARSGSLNRDNAEVHDKEVGHDD